MTSSADTTTIILDPQRVLRTLLIIIAALVFFSTVTQILYYTAPRFPTLYFFTHFFDLDQERNAPTAFSSLLHLTCAVLVWVVGTARRRVQLPYPVRWRFLMFLFLLTASDELFVLHERAGPPMRKLFGLVDGIFYFAWVIPGIVFVVTIGLLLARLVLDLPPPIRRLVIASGLIFVGGAIGVEMLGADQFSEVGHKTLRDLPFFTIEEAMEMIGPSVFIYAMLRYLRDHLGGAQISVPPAAGART